MSTWLWSMRRYNSWMCCICEYAHIKCCKNVLTRINLSLLIFAGLILSTWLWSICCYNSWMCGIYKYTDIQLYEKFLLFQPFPLMFITASLDLYKYVPGSGACVVATVGCVVSVIKYKINGIRWS